MTSELICLTDFCEIMHCKKTKGRELLRKEPYGIKVGGTWFAQRRKLQRWIDENTNDRKEKKRG